MSTLSVSLLNPLTRVNDIVAKSTFFTSLVILVPMIAVFALLLFCEYGIKTINLNNNDYDVQEYRHILLTPVYVIASITWISGFAGLISTRLKLQTILKICSYVYAAIGYWCILNIIILIFTAWSYLTISTICHIFLWSSLVTLFWLLSSSVMKAYAEEMSLAVYDMV
jgi:hypothetical protein